MASSDQHGGDGPPMNKKVGRFQIVTNVQTPERSVPALQSPKLLLPAPPQPPDPHKTATIPETIEPLDRGDTASNKTIASPTTTLGRPDEHIVNGTSTPIRKLSDSNSSRNGGGDEDGGGRIVSFAVMKSQAPVEENVGRYRILDLNNSNVVKEDNPPNSYERTIKLIRGETNKDGKKFMGPTIKFTVHDLPKVPPNNSGNNGTRSRSGSVTTDSAELRTTSGSVTPSMQSVPANVPTQGTRSLPPSSLSDTNMVAVAQRLETEQALRNRAATTGDARGNREAGRRGGSPEHARPENPLTGGGAGAEASPAHAPNARGRDDGAAPQVGRRPSGSYAAAAAVPPSTEAGTNAGASTGSSVGPAQPRNVTKQGNSHPSAPTQAPMGNPKSGGKQAQGSGASLQPTSKQTQAPPSQRPSLSGQPAKAPTGPPQGQAPGTKPPPASQARQQSPQPPAVSRSQAVPQATSQRTQRPSQAHVATSQASNQRQAHPPSTQTPALQPARGSATDGGLAGGLPPGTSGWDGVSAALDVSAPENNANVLKIIATQNAMIQRMQEKMMHKIFHIETQVGLSKVQSLEATIKVLNKRVKDLEQENAELKTTLLQAQKSPPTTDAPVDPAGTTGPPVGASGSGSFVSGAAGGGSFVGGAAGGGGFVGGAAGLLTPMTPVPLGLLGMPVQMLGGPRGSMSGPSGGVGMPVTTVGSTATPQPPQAQAQAQPLKRQAPQAQQQQQQQVQQQRSSQQQQPQQQQTQQQGQPPGQLQQQHQQNTHAQHVQAQPLQQQPPSQPQQQQLPQGQGQLSGQVPASTSQQQQKQLLQQQQQQQMQFQQIQKQQQQQFLQQQQNLLLQPQPHQLYQSIGSNMMGLGVMVGAGVGMGAGASQQQLPSSQQTQPVQTQPHASLTPTVMVTPDQLMGLQHFQHQHMLRMQQAQQVQQTQQTQQTQPQSLLPTSTPVASHLLDTSIPHATPPGSRRTTGQ
eukprot:m.1258931 g.1258931  ORF g.1258931 m.1258931 type:complete len:972 (-) comp24724_c1_seq5:460-3375(-)